VAGVQQVHAFLHSFSASRRKVPVYNHRVKGKRISRASNLRVETGTRRAKLAFMRNEQRPPVARQLDHGAYTQIPHGGS